MSPGSQSAGSGAGQALAGRDPDRPVALHRPLEQVGDPDEPGDELLGRVLVDVLGRPALGDPAAAHHGDPVRHRERLLLIVGHVDERDPDLALDLLELDLHLPAQLQVERAERLVEQEHGGPVDQRARQGDPLALAAGELGRAGLGALGEPDELERLADPPRDLVLGDLAALQPEGDVALDVEVAEERVALEDHVDVALVGRHLLDGLALEQDASLGRDLEAGEHPQRRRLAAARRAEQREELAGGDRQVDRVDGGEVAEALADALEADRLPRRRRRAVRRSGRLDHLNHLPVRSGP